MLLINLLYSGVAPNTNTPLEGGMGDIQNSYNDYIIMIVVFLQIYKACWFVSWTQIFSQKKHVDILQK